MNSEAFENKMRIIQELVPGKQITLAHIIANPDAILYKKLGLDPAIDYSKAAIGIVTMSPAEYAIVGADLAIKKSGAQLGFVDRFSGTLIVTGPVSEVEASLRALADYVKNKSGVVLDPNSRFDVQIKRMHEYKRQLLNCLRIIYLYDLLLENPDLNIHPQTFIFGVKAAPGYYMAKQIIKLIWNLSAEIEKNPKIREKLRVVFMEDYNVSLADVLIPAAEVSEQISLAGKEASGTGNM